MLILLGDPAEADRVTTGSAERSCVTYRGRAAHSDVHSRGWYNYLALWRCSCGADSALGNSMCNQRLKLHSFIQAVSGCTCARPARKVWTTLLFYCSLVRREKSKQYTTQQMHTVRSVLKRFGIAFGVPPELHYHCQNRAPVLAFSCSEVCTSKGIGRAFCISSWRREAFLDQVPSMEAHDEPGACSPDGAMLSKGLRVPLPAFACRCLLVTAVRWGQSPLRICGRPRSQLQHAFCFKRACPLCQISSWKVWRSRPPSSECLC